MDTLVETKRVRVYLDAADVTPAENVDDNVESGLMSVDIDCPTALKIGVMGIWCAVWAIPASIFFHVHEAYENIRTSKGPIN